jgi:hypothetical protein
MLGTGGANGQNTDLHLLSGLNLGHLLEPATPEHTAASTRHDQGHLVA